MGFLCLLVYGVIDAIKVNSNRTTIRMTDILRKKEKFFGRRKGRPLGDQTVQLIESTLPKFKIEIENKEIINPVDIFSASYESFALEIGFGGGEHLADQAHKNPLVGYIGVEVFLNGVASLLCHVERDKIDNIRIFPDDVRPLLAKLKDQSLMQIYVLFPDPWPKARHHKRRIIQKERISVFARLLQKGGTLCMATDVPGYLEWMQDIMSASKDFQRRHVYTTDTKPESWIETRYEEKARQKGRSSTYLIYERI